MATGTNIAFNHTARLLGDGVFDLGNDVFKVMALSATPTAAMTLKSQVTAATNLSAATITLTDSWVTTATDDAKYDASNVTFTATGASTIRAWCIYDDTTTSPLDGLVVFGDVDTAATAITLANGEKLQLSFNASGILQIQAA